MSENLDSILGVNSDPTPSADHSNLVNRYRDAYLVASAAIGFGTLIKSLGWIVAIIIWISGFVVAGGYSFDTGGPVFVIGGLVSGVIQLIVFYFFGVMVVAAGQILRATIDTAVHSSPFLDEQQKSHAMRI